jgi:hypothetical protein
MRVYKDYSQSPDGWNITAILTLDDDGRFRYDELWTDYTNVTLGGEARGHWRRSGGGELVFHTESADGVASQWVVGQERTAVEQGDRLDFGPGWTPRLQPAAEPVSDDD